MLQVLSDFLAVIYPVPCGGCNEILLRNERELCTSCLAALPFTGFHLQKENPVERIFWGRVTLQKATSLLLFKKGTIVQNILHSLKYKGRSGIGVLLGELAGATIELGDADAIVPVPLHRSRLRSRGYNQSLCYAAGISSASGIPVLEGALKRIVAEASQTRKRRAERWASAGSIYHCDPELVTGKHILLVDDVVTTGATVEACAIELLAAGASVSLLTIAWAER